MKTRKTKEPKKLAKVETKKKDTWVFVANRKILSDVDNSSDPTIVRLRHPNSGQPCLYLLNADRTIIQEIQTFSEDKRCWFVDDIVIPDGIMHISTPVDPLFLILPYLKEATVCSPLEQLVTDDEFPEIENILNCSGIENMEQIADRKGDKSLNAFVYNRDKTLLWLQKKTERVASLLEAKNIHVSGNSVVSVNFVNTANSTDSKENYLKYAHGMISEYLPADLSKDLALHLKLPAESEIPNNNKRKKNALETVVINDDNKDDDNEKEDKKSIKKLKQETKDQVKMEPANDTEEVKLKKVKTELTPKQSAKEKSRAKAAAGTKSISSFFKKV